MSTEIRQVRVRHENPRSVPFQPGQCKNSHCRTEIPLDAEFCQDCIEAFVEDAAIKAERDNAVDEIYEKIEAERQAAYQEALNRQYEEELARNERMKAISSEKAWAERSEWLQK